ncbi:MAG: prolyl oligopeptidase family serine peptidase [Phycisphaerales bacterium]|nr:prolyl oligopeptidase family serine peptidase [Phycisphaerales bacterium]
MVAIGRSRFAGGLLKFVLLGAPLIPIIGAGCIPPPLPDNLEADAPHRSLLREAPRAVVRQEDGVLDAAWLEITRDDGKAVGGYVSLQKSPRGALVLLVDGASTFQETGSDAQALTFHRDFGADLRAFGFRTWSLSVQECGTAYGQDDVDDLVAVLDWLDDVGLEALNVERVYIVGYSTGATVTQIASQRRKVTAAVSLAGLSQPDQLEELYDVYRWVSDLYPHNAGLCKLADTLAFYGPPGSMAWEALDSVSHVTEFKHPMLFVHGMRDIIYFPENTLAMEMAYLTARGRRAGVPEMTFKYLPEGEHYTVRSDPAVRLSVIRWLETFEPDPSPVPLNGIPGLKE